MLPPVCKIKYFDFYFFCLLSNKKYGVWKISNWKINTWKIPTHQILPLRISSGKFSPRKFSPGIFPPMFINIFFHHYHRYHQYCLKDCFEFLFLKKMLKSDLLRCIKKKFVACLPFGKCFGYDGNVFHILIQEMCNFSKIRLHQKEIFKEPKKACEESLCLLKTTFLQHPCDHLYLCITFSNLRKA